MKYTFIILIIVCIYSCDNKKKMCIRDRYMSQYKEAINSALSYMRQENVVMQNQLNQENSRYIDNYYTWNNNIARCV